MKTKTRIYDALLDERLMKYWKIAWSMAPDEGGLRWRELFRQTTRSRGRASPNIPFPTLIIIETMGDGVFAHFSKWVAIPVMH